MCRETSEGKDLKVTCENLARVHFIMLADYKELTCKYSVLLQILRNFTNHSEKYEFRKCTVLVPL